MKIDKFGIVGKIDGKNEWIGREKKLPAKKKFWPWGSGSFGSFPHDLTDRVKESACFTMFINIESLFVTVSNHSCSALIKTRVTCGMPVILPS